MMRSTLPTSHGFVSLNGTATSPLPASLAPKSAFVANFEFVGSIDNAPYLCVPAAIAWRESIGGEEAIRKYCHDLVTEGAKKVAAVLGTEVLDNESKTLTRCCMANVRLPLDVANLQGMAAQAGVGAGKVGMLVRDWVNRTLVNDYHTYVATMWYGGAWWVRMSGQVYLDIEDFEWAADVLKKVAQRTASGEWLGPTSKL
jgi:selenocysteine lyase/cysteine desulfurase